MSTVNRCYRLRSFPEGKITKDDLELVEEAFPECQGENESADSTDGGASHATCVASFSHFVRFTFYLTDCGSFLV
jgi:hypothetical protein